MISVIVYGRNDAHGYNLHRRAALSLNCIAEVLTDPGDEIVFVDYNSPDELPTFVEALADTLTERCLDLLRVLRVPAEFHERRFATRTHLRVIEPVARNVAVRRANPANRWLLSTNTDMIFLPLGGDSLSEICGQLPDGFFGLPRFELPEWLWERLPRTDPRCAMAEIARLGPRLRLDEPTVSNEWIRFDAPGDFQLVLREDFFAIDGLDEEMLLGYHVDSNLSRRMLLHRGSIESLGDSLAGYHCNHIREPTIYHGAGKVANDLERFVVRIDQPTLPPQRASWGLADVVLEEVPVRERSGLLFAESLASAIPPPAAPSPGSDAARVPFELTYDSGHVLPFVADSLAVSAPTATVAYFGVNDALLRMLAAATAQLGFDRPLQVGDLDDMESVDGLARTADVFVVDLGVDASFVASPPATITGYAPEPFPARLDLAFLALERLVEVERARLERGEHPRRIVLVHSWTVFWDGYVLANLDCSHTTAHSRVRRATVKPTPIDDDDTRAAVARERRLIRWAARAAVADRRLRLRPGEPVAFADASDYLGFREGWSYPDEGGIWTQGSRSEFALAFEGVVEAEHVLAFGLGGVCVGSEAPLRVALLVDGEPAADREFRRDDLGEPTWHVGLPPRALAQGTVDLTFLIDEPTTPTAVGWSIEDDRPLGIQLRELELVSADDAATKVALAAERRLVRWGARGEAGNGRLPLRLGEALDLADTSDYTGFREGWSYPDDEGIWTRGSRSELEVAFEGAKDADRPLLAFSLEGVCAAPEAPLRVAVALNGDVVSTRDFVDEPARCTWHVELPERLLAEGRADVAFIVEEPRTPRSLGWSEDDRELGLHIRAIGLVSAADDAVRAALSLEGRLMRWAARGRYDGRLQLRPGEAVDLADSADYRGFGDGWSFPNEAGIWTQGPRAELALAVEGGGPGDQLLALAVERVCASPEAPLRVEALVGGVRAARTFTDDESNGAWHIELPALPPDGGEVDLTLLIEEPGSPAALGWSDDDRPLGLFVRALEVRNANRSVRLGEKVVFAPGTDADRLLDEGWAAPESTGVWTLGDRAMIVLEPTAPHSNEIELVLCMSALVAPGGPELAVEVLAGSEKLATHVFPEGNVRRRLRTPLPTTVRDADGRVTVELRLTSPARPIDLGLGVDRRRLGVHLEWLAVRKLGLRTTLSDAIRDTAAAVRRTRASSRA